MYVCVYVCVSTYMQLYIHYVNKHMIETTVSIHADVLAGAHAAR